MSIEKICAVRHRRFTAKAACLLLAAAVTLGSLAQAATPKPDRYPNPSRYNERIDLWVAQDKETNPPKGGIVFTGSSTITRWNNNLPQDFEGFTVLGRGFGGSTINDSVHFADKTVIPHQPRQIVFYAGENDIAAKRTPQGVLEDFQEFVTKVKGELPQVQILYISMKPSPRRWELQPKFDEANALIQAYCEATDGLTFVNIREALLGADGQPREDLFVEDRLHINAEGYKILQNIIQPLLLPEPAATGDEVKEGDVPRAAPQKDGKGGKKKQENADMMMM